MILIPNTIRAELKRCYQKKPFVVRAQKPLSFEYLYPKAIERLIFFNEIANHSLLHPFLQKYSILILDHFSPYYHDSPQGGLWLETIGTNTGLFYWIDADYPANRSETDHELVNDDHIKGWNKKSVERFALLKEKEIWAAIKHWLQVHRSVVFGEKSV